jgi:hypothetical protein
MHKLFIDYALKCDNLKKALPSAHAVLEVEPEYVPAMAVEMVRVAMGGDPGKAKPMARRILELDKTVDSPWRQYAEKVHEMGRDEGRTDGEQAPTTNAETMEQH